MQGEDNLDIKSFLSNILNIVYVNESANNIFSLSDNNKEIYFYNDNILNLIKNSREFVELMVLRGLDLNDEAVRGEIRTLITEILRVKPDAKDPKRACLNYSSPAFVCGISDFVFSLTIPNGYDFKRYYNFAERLVIIQRLFQHAFKILDLDFIDFLLNNYADSLPIDFLKNYAVPRVDILNGILGALPIQYSPRRAPLTRDDALRIFVGKELFALGLVRSQENGDTLERRIRLLIRNYLDSLN